MNGATNTSFPVLKRSTSPRPPAVGEEVKRFHDTSHPEQYKNWNMDYNSKTACVESVDQPVRPCTENVAESRDCTESPPNSSPPAAVKWAQSLQCLLEDIQGVSLFKKFLEQEGQDMSCFSFWFACRGVKRIDPNDREALVKLIKIVFSKKVKRISAISDESKDEIKQKLATNTNVDNTIFDKAQQEVEAYMMKTTYPNFLKSDLYIQHIQQAGGWQNELSAEKERVFTPEPTEQLPTVHEDSELHIPAKIPLTKTNLLQRNKSPFVSRCKAEAPPGSLRSPYSNYGSYHSKYGSFLPTSAQDSELQSLSSDAQTDDTMSLTDGSNADYPIHSRSKHKQRPQKVMKHINNPIYNAKDRLSLGNFVPLTDRPPPKPQDQEEFYNALFKALTKVVEERKQTEKLNERMKTVEDSKPVDTLFLSAPTSDVSARQSHKGNYSFLTEQPEENVQDILDKHISRVFDSEQPTPGMLSPTALRPSGDLLEKARVPLQSSGCNELSEYSSMCKHNQVPHSSVPNSIKSRRDHDTISTDSAMYDYKSDDNLPIDYSRRCKEHSKRSVSKKFSSFTGSSSSFFDSGISCESVPSYSKVKNWLETKRIAEQEKEQHSWRNSSTSPVLNRSSSNRKTGYTSCRGGSQDPGYSQWSGAPAQQYPHDSAVLAYSAPDTTTCNLVEARKRLEDENRAKMKMKKPNRKSYSLNVVEAATANNPPSNDVTVIGYSYGRLAVPYLSKMPGKNITLRQFKSMLSKKGNFRYFFKTASNDFGTGVVFEEVTEDSKVLPLWEGKVFCVIESIDDSCVM